MGLQAAVDLENIDQFADQVGEACAFLKTMSHESRLAILCRLVSGEKSVNELEALLSERQAAVSQHLARLRFEGFVQTRREGKEIYYSLKDERVVSLLQVVANTFCPTDDD